MSLKDRYCNTVQNKRRGTEYKFCTLELSESQTTGRKKKYYIWTGHALKFTLVQVNSFVIFTTFTNNQYKMQHPTK
jgi:hypothetical protein